MPIAAAGSSAVQGATNGISGLISGITGFFQKKKGNALLNQTQYPDEAMPAEVLQNQELAQLRANTGLPSEQYNQAKQNISRQQNQALASATDRRAGLDMTAQNQQVGTDANLQLDSANAQARLQNQSQLMSVNNQVASWRDKLFQWNQVNRYNQQRDYAMGLIGIGNQNLYSGVDKLLAGGAKAASGMNFGGNKTSNMSNGSGPVITGSQIDF